MDNIWKAVTRRQFGAAIDMLENALNACPPELWSAPILRDQPDRTEISAFWYVAYHALFWLDLYLFGSVEGFRPPAPFNLAELDPAGLLPERQFSKDELLTYLGHGRQKCRKTIESLTDEKSHQRCRFSWGEVSFAELLLYNLRHIQEHAAQLNLFLGQEFGSDARWVPL
jgi:hypothetical protein